MKRKSTKDSLGDLLVESLTELRDGLKGEPGKLTMKTVEIPDPAHFGAAKVHQLRDRLGLSQALFARLLGVSSKLVEAWETGTRTPSLMACRLLESIARSPSRYVRHHRRVVK
jgi:putative transcriptional regulator